MSAHDPTASADTGPPGADMPAPRRRPDLCQGETAVTRPQNEEAVGLTVSHGPESAGPTPADLGGSTGLANGPPGYELIRGLGRGGMGVVYLARQVKADRLVALKVLQGGAHAGPDELARFRAEAEALARL